MRNTTASSPEKTRRKAKIGTAELEAPVSALERELLEGVAQATSEFERRRRLQAKVLATVTRFRAGERLSREEAHDRSYDAMRVENPIRART